MAAIGILITSAILIAIICQRIRIPYAVGLICGGFVLSLLSVKVGIALSSKLILVAILPALIFDAAISLDWSATRSSLSGIILIAVVGVLLTGGICAAGLHFLLAWPWAASSVFGALIAATDPVAVLAIFKNHPVPRRLRALVQGESLLNDGVAATIFMLVVGWTKGQSIGVGIVSWSLFKSIAGGIACGAVATLIASILIGRTRDELVEISITILVAYGSYTIADSLGMSGILASLTAGLLLRNLQAFIHISKSGRSAIGPFWRFAAFAANSIVFILIGINEARISFEEEVVPVAVAFVLILAARAMTIYPFTWLTRRTGYPFRPGTQHVLFWGGLRGALPLALALSIPSGLPMRATVVTVAFGVVAVSLLLQGLSLPALLRRVCR